MINLFEYQNRLKFEGSFQELEYFLDKIWNNREKSGYYYGKESDNVSDMPETQRFLQLLHRTNELKSNKYVGTIHFEDKKINLLPKIFYDSSRDCSPKEIHSIQNHIIWWLSYCKKIKFPNYLTSLDSYKNDFLEVLIYLFSKYTRELLANSVYQQYEEIERELPYIKGRLNSGRYITENLSKGRWHKINCTYDSFIFDNKFNRIIKYVAKLLFNVTNNAENKKYLREILFILDDVSDRTATARECSTIQFNPIFGEFETVRDFCYLFLNNSISFDYKNELKLFAFLLPMEYVFEDFIFGFIDKEIEGVEATAQKKSEYLDIAGNFSLRPDLVLEVDSRTIIADTKYKIIYCDEKDPKNGISQSDLYQMLAYAVRFKANEIVLFYPDTIKNYQEKEFEITIRDELADGVDVNIKSFQLPIINRSMFDPSMAGEMDTTDSFDYTRMKLIERITSILKGTDILVVDNKRK
ncbi:hypothetical protein QUF76_06820 [Desulfobacterales bacterium HSG16]|nr:hypothetical protein [Desulfobacterales bacterium HSG16]